MSISVATLAVWNSLGFAVAVLGGFSIGVIARRKGHRVALACVLAAGVVSCVGMGIASSDYGVLISRLVAAFAFGGTWGTTHAAVIAISSRQDRSLLAGIVQTGPPLGAGMAAAVTSWLGPALADHMEYPAWRISAIAAAGTVACAIPLLAFLPGWTPKVKPIVPVAADRGESRPLFVQFRSAFNLAPCIAVLALHMAAYWCSFAWLPQHLIQERGVSRHDAGFMLVGLSVAQVVGDLLFGRFATRVGPIRALVIGSLAVAMGFITLAAGWATLASSPWALAACLAILGLGMGLWSTFSPLFESRFDDAGRATGLSSLYNIARIIQIPAQLSVATIYASTGSLAPTLVLSAACTAAALIFLPRLQQHDAKRTIHP